MRTNYVLIDYENVQPKDLSLLNGHPFKVFVFLGANQNDVPRDVVKTLQPLGANADYIWINGNGRNALDFHVAFYLGKFATTDPEGYFHVISKDRGFERLLEHLKECGIRVQQSRTLAEIPLLAPAAPMSLDERVDAVIKNLTSRRAGLPGTSKTLASTIHALFHKKLEQSEVAKVIAALEKRGSINVKDGKVSYRL